MIDDRAMRPGPKTTELIALVREAAAELRAQSHAYWATWLDAGANALERNQIGGITQLLAAFGGMGSITDLLLPDELQQRLGRIHGLAAEIQREAEFF